MSGERINNTLRNNGIAGGVFSFSLNDLLNGNGNGNGNGNETAGNGSNNRSTPGAVQFTSLGDTIANVFQAGGAGQGTPDIAAIVNNVVQSLNNAVVDPHASHRRATQRALDALKPLHLDEIPAEARSSNCPICYEPYVEYKSESENDQPPAAAAAATVAAEPRQQETSPADEILVGPWKGYDLTDPSISFPAIETATYQHTYALATEPDLGLDTEINASTPTATTTPDAATDSHPIDNDREDQDIHYAVKLPQCNHIFGRPCIVEWLQSNVSCPLCRREIVPELTEDTRTTLQPTANGTLPNERTYVYDTAITETYVPVDWTAPLSAGYILSDPPLTLPVVGVGMSSGRRTGRDP